MINSIYHRLLYNAWISEASLFQLLPAFILYWHALLNLRSLQKIHWLVYHWNMASLWSLANLRRANQLCQWATDSVHFRDVLYIPIEHSAGLASSRVHARIAAYSRLSFNSVSSSFSDRSRADSDEDMGHELDDVAKHKYSHICTTVCEDVDEMSIPTPKASRVTTSSSFWDFTKAASLYLSLNYW